MVFARNDGNLTRMEVLLGIGQMQGVLTVLVNDVQIPLGVTGTNMTGTGWYNVQTLGTRDGAFDPNFTDASGAPAGDPYGSMAYLSVVVPNQINNGTSLPSVKVLVKGLMVPVYAADGTYMSDQFSSNPAWILLDVLRERMGARRRSTSPASPQRRHTATKRSPRSISTETRSLCRGFSATCFCKTGAARETWSGAFATARACT